MRAIFILLLVVNLGFFFYEYFSEEKENKVIGENVAVQEQGERLELLVESRTGRVKKRVERVIEPAGGQKELGKDKICTMIGPFEQLIRAEFLVDKFKSLSVEATITPVERIEGKMYWVYLAPELSQQEALMRLYELQKKNIESYLITKGELERGISFGQYADRIDAEIKMSEIKEQGYSADMKELNKTISETWVTLLPEAAEKISDSLWVGILNDDPGLEKRQNFCISVASQ